MAEGRRSHDWDLTATVLAQTHNLNRDPKKGKPATPDDYHPMRRPVRSKDVPRRLKDGDRKAIQALLGIRKTAK